MWRTELPVSERNPDTFSIYAETGQRTRKRHHKSRNGCIPCKQRRIKCSEDWPACKHCIRLHKLCRYPHRGQNSSRSPAEGLSPNTAIGKDSRLVVSSVKAQVWAAIESGEGIDSDLLAYSPLLRAQALESLDHFVQCDRPWLKDPIIQSIMQGDAINDVLGEAYLLHAVLGVANAHLFTLYPRKHSYNVAASVHWQRSLQQYTSRLGGCLESQNIGALFFCSHLHSILAATGRRQDARENQWELPSWLGSLRGVKALWDIPFVRSQLRRGAWRYWVEANEPAYQRVINCPATAIPDASQKHDTPCESISPEGCETLSDIITTLLELSRPLPEDDAAVYGDRIHALNILEHCSSMSEATNPTSWFITRAPSGFLLRLRRGENMALLLLLYWFGLAMTLGQWWVVQASRREFGELYAHLFRTCNDKGERLVLDKIAGTATNLDSGEVRVLEVTEQGP